VLTHWFSESSERGRKDGSRSLNRLVGGSILSLWPPFGRTRITSEAARDEADCLDSTF